MRATSLCSGDGRTSIRNQAAALWLRLKGGSDGPTQRYCRHASTSRSSALGRSVLTIELQQDGGRGERSGLRGRRLQSPDVFLARTYESPFSVNKTSCRRSPVQS